MRWPRLPPSYSVSELVGNSAEVEPEAGVVGQRRVAHVVEHEELGLGSEIHGVADAHRLHHGFRLLGDAAGIAVVGLAGGRLEHVADQDQGGLGEEGIDGRGDRIGHQAHVGFVDRLPAGNRGTVEHQAFGEGVLFDHARIERHVLPLAARIGETQVDVFHVVVLHMLQDVFGGLHEYPSWYKVLVIRPRTQPAG